MKNKDIMALGVPRGRATKAASRAVAQACRSGWSRRDVRGVLREVVAAPELFVDHAVFGRLADILLDRRREAHPRATEREGGPAPYAIFGENLDSGALDQMEAAASLPVAVSGALLPDVHVGYGLPIGGVLAVKNSVIPYAVGVDIACRMKLSVLDIPESDLVQRRERLVAALDMETRFGTGASFESKGGGKGGAKSGGGLREHRGMDEDWNFCRVVAKERDRAARQLGTSGSGNHFVEYGSLIVEGDEGARALGLPPGRYAALLSHSGSRGAGHAVAKHFSRVASEAHPELSGPLRHLAWLDMESADGRAYWEAMQLMGRYAAANHELIHAHVARRLGVEILAGVENHHNFAWIEEHAGRRVVVHRKGATPAGAGQLGVIPGSMTAPAYVVRGCGDIRSLCSASHGAGRRMSRKQALASFTWADVRHACEQHGVHLIAAGLDEAPMAYKDIETVMAAQRDLVDVMARFEPVIVRMAGRAG